MTKGIGEILVLMLMLPFFAEAQIIPEYKDIPQLSSKYEILDRSLFSGTAIYHEDGDLWEPTEYIKVISRKDADNIKQSNDYCTYFSNYKKYGGTYVLDDKNGKPREYYGFLKNEVHGRTFINDRIYVYKEFYPNDGLKRKKICSIDGFSIGKEYVYDSKGKLVRIINHGNTNIDAYVFNKKILKEYATIPMLSRSFESITAIDGGKDKCTNIFEEFWFENKNVYRKFDSSGMVSKEYRGRYYYDEMPTRIMCTPPRSIGDSMIMFVTKDIKYLYNYHKAYTKIRLIEREYLTNSICILKQYDEKGFLRSKKIVSEYGFAIGKEYIYDGGGNVWVTIDTDEGYSIKAYDIIKYWIEKGKGFHTWNREFDEIVKVKDENGNPCWLIKIFNEEKKYECTLLDGKTGNVIRKYTINKNREYVSAPTPYLDGGYNYDEIREFENIVKNVYNYEEVDKAPVYPGGVASLMYDVTNNCRDASFRLSVREGLVMVRFIVDEHGNAIMAEPCPRFDFGCVSHVISSISTLKKFEPAEKNGEKVKVFIMVPVVKRVYR